MIVRDEDASDHAAVRKILEAAFSGSVEADLVERLRADGDCEFGLIAVDDGEVAGHVMFSRMGAPFRALSLAPVAIAPSRQRTGIGSRLIREGLDRARNAGWEGVFVLGDPRYYARFCFDPLLASGFTSPYAGPHLMALALGRALPTSSGKIVHARAFGS